jgi:hypothetical protein
MNRRTGDIPRIPGAWPLLGHTLPCSATRADWFNPPAAKAACPATPSPTAAVS